MADTLLLDTDAEILQLHYYLKDSSHSMDAFAFNKAESELLKTIEVISKIFGVEILVETEALGEGGLRANYRFKPKKNSAAITKDLRTILVAIVAGVLTDLSTGALNKDSELDDLTKEKTRLEILHLTNQIKKDSAEIDKNKDAVQIEEILPTIDTINVDSIAKFISDRNKIKMHRSNFYRAIKEDEKITKVSTVALNENHKPVSDEKTVVRADFSTFIIDNTRIDDLYEDNVRIEIIAPVLDGTGIRWRGLYQGKHITFSMKDQGFKDLIINKNLKFSHGTMMLCDLETKRRVNKEGDIILGAKNVYDVREIKYQDGDRIDILPA